WYKADIQVSKAAPTVSFKVTGNRYAMEVSGDITIKQSGAIYLATDNLNISLDGKLVDLTDWSEADRNRTESVANMIVDPDTTPAQTLAELSALIDVRYIGDANDDGYVNVKDATAIQKNLVGILTFSSEDNDIADFDCDGKLTIKDATAIQKKLVALL
ncbi:MAG: dockerin type I repeat-containing protein, partial [Ruminococcus sp.]